MTEIERHDYDVVVIGAGGAEGRKHALQIDGLDGELATRSGERNLAFRSSIGVLVVRRDGALVAWNPVSGAEEIVTSEKRILVKQAISDSSSAT